MPRFFNSDSLTEKQKANWDYAVEQYAQVREQCKRRMISDGIDERTAEAMIGMTFMCPDSPSNMEKSALFARLLEGKAPLPHPPPTSFSYPWYEVVEKPGPFEVVFDGILDPEDSPCPSCRAALINQHPWKIVSENQAARDVLADKLKKDIVAASPVIEVETGPWTGYRLTVRRKTIETWRGVVDDPDALLLSVPTEPRILRSIRPGESPERELVACEVNCWMLERCETP